MYKTSIVKRLMIPTSALRHPWRYVHINLTDNHNQHEEQGRQVHKQEHHSMHFSGETNTLWAGTEESGFIGERGHCSLIHSVEVYFQ
jgi:hypothetical protein